MIQTSDDLRELTREDVTQANSLSLKWMKAVYKT